jgi:hypothetical protein
MNTLMAIARCLHKKYREKYARRYVQLEPGNRSFPMKLAIIFRYASAPYRPYMLIYFNDAIIVETGQRETRPHMSTNWRFEETARVLYEDPNMEENLDKIVADVVSRTPKYEPGKLKNGLKW